MVAATRKAVGTWLPGRLGLVVALSAAVFAAPGEGQERTQQAGQTVELTLERMVELGLRDSYRVRQLQLGVERTRSNLRAEQAGLKSRVELEVAAPEFAVISDYKWDSELQRNELVSENTRRWELDLSVRQPVILFGFPTNGFLSLNNRMYRYTQIGEEERDVRFYNRYFIGYDQPLFQPNRMKNDLEEAELDLERAELDFRDDVVGIVTDLADDYLELFESAYERVIATSYVDRLESVAAAAADLAELAPTRAIEADQMDVALVNAREETQQTVSQFRLQAAELKQRLRLNASDSITVSPEARVEPLHVDVDRAVELATTLAPRMRELAISRRQSEIRLSEVRGSDAFRMNVRLTYGREVQDPRFENLWSEPRNSYTVDVSATIPIWDWGERKHRIQAQLYSMEAQDLSIEEAHTSIRTNVENEVRNLEEYQGRALSMQTNLEGAQRITDTMIERYRAGEVALLDVLNAVDREQDTAQNFLNAFLGFRRSVLELQEMTYWDFEMDLPLLDRYAIETDDLN